MSAFDRVREIRDGLARELRVYRLVLQQPRCPRRAKILFCAALAYLAMPFDLVPDFIPVIGLLDDAVIVPGLVWLALRSIPKDVIDECRKQATATPR